MTEDRLKVTHLLGKKLDEPIVITWESKTESALKPCPFCGGEAGVDIGNYGGIVCYCKKCFSQGKQCKTEEEAIKAWNTRNNEIKASTSWDEDAKNKIKSTSWSVKAEES